MPRTTLFHTATPVVALFILSACAQPAPEPVVTRDSAGVPLMFSSVAAWAPEEAWRVDPDPAFTLGGLRGQRHHDFTAAGEAGLLEAGRILVTHRSAPPEVRMYQADGSFVRAFCTDGSADGQCRFVLRSWIAGRDTLIVFDPTLGRLTYFDLRGRPLDVKRLGAGPDAPLWIDRLADGRLLGRPSNPQPADAGRSRARFAYTTLEPRTLAIEPFAEAAGGEFVVSVADAGHRLVEQVLFAPFTAAAARGSSVYLSDTEDFWIEERAADGALIRRFGRSWTPERLDRRFIRDYSEQRLAAAGSAARAVRQELERAVFSDRFPAHDATMIVDASDHLWVLHLPAGRGADRVWSVFAPDGRWLGEVSTPARLRVTGIGSDRMIGIWQDAAGIQTVRIHYLVKPGLVRDPPPPVAQHAPSTVH
jgi:hypothetical protein